MTSRDRHALLLGGVTIAVAILALRVVPWGVRTVLAAERDLRERAALLARAQDELAGMPALRDSVAGLSRAVGRLAPALLDGDTRAEAAADLAARLNLAASRSRAKLERTDELPDSGAAGWLKRVRVRAAFETDIRGLVGVLRALEGDGTAVSVDQVRVTAPDVASPDRVPERLRVEVTVAGWYLTKRDGGRGKGEG